MQLIEVVYKLIGINLLILLNFYRLLSYSIIILESKYNKNKYGYWYIENIKIDI